MKKSNLLLPSMLAGFALAASANAATIVVAENFGGLAANNLHGTSADTFNSSITAAGGSATWGADEAFKADGSATGSRKAAYLNLGSYINDAKGTANGLFVLQATVVRPTGGDSFSLGFSNDSSPSLVNNYWGAGIPAGSGNIPSTAVGTMIYESTGDIQGYGVGGFSGFVSGTSGNTASHILTITLDLRAWNNTDNFGSVTFGANTGTLGAYEEYGSFNHTSNQNFNSILLSISAATQDTTTGSYDNLTLTQIPEPSAALLGGLGMLVLLRRRR